jgi:hypothetical protein
MLRLGEKVLRDLDEIVKRRNRETGMDLNRTDILRWLITKEKRVGR